MLEPIILFLSSFIAATILPAQSEIVLASLIISSNYSKTLLLTVATTGNVIGSLINWILGYYLINLKDTKWFPLKPEQVSRYSNIYQKFGKWSLLMAWLPIIGDPLTIIAGVFRVNIWLFLILVTIGKLTRYVFIVLMAS